MSQVLEATQRVWAANRKLSGDSVHDGRHGDPNRSDAAADVQGGVAGRSRPGRQHDFGLREGIQRRRDDADHDRRRADFWRLRLHEGLSGREADARCEAATDLRGHVANPASRDRAQPAQGVSAARAGQFAGTTGCGIGGSWSAGSLPVIAPTYSPSWYTSTRPVVGSGNRFHSSGGGASEGGAYTTGAGAAGAGGGAAEHEAIAIDNSRGNVAREILLFMVRR